MATGHTVWASELDLPVRWSCFHCKSLVVCQLHIPGVSVLDYWYLQRSRTEVLREESCDDWPDW